jgi:hypothetical protein
MSDWGRIHRRFWRHKKVESIPLAAVGLWAVCNSWSRDNRTGGFIPENLTFVEGHSDLVNHLLSGLWDKVEGGYQFHDYEDWNGDDLPRTLPAKLVYNTLRTGHPESVVDAVVKRVADLLEQNVKPAVIEAALLKWDTRQASPVVLDYIVSDILRESQDLEAVVDKCLETNTVVPLKAFGHYFPEPEDAPPHASHAELRAFMKKRRRDWLLALKQSL